MKLVDDVRSLLSASPQMAGVLNIAEFTNFAQLAGALFTSLCNNSVIGNVVAETYSKNQELIDATCYDIAETARRNFEPGGQPATLLFARGVHAIMGYRVTHQLWNSGDTNLSLAMKAAFGRVFSTDVHPAAKIGKGLWLDHGLGFVVGETAVIEENVSIWHNVTLGSTLNDSGPNRHPHIGTGAVIGAGAVLLGDITVGAHANIAAGAIVVNDIPAGALAVGTKASLCGNAQISFIENERKP